MSNGFPSTQEAPLCNEVVKQASVKNGERENGELRQECEQAFNMLKIQCLLQRSPASMMRGSTN